MATTEKTLRLLFPQWQGGNNPPYFLGAQLLAWLAPPTTGPVEEVPVPAPSDETLSEERGMVARHQLVEQQSEARALIERHQPDAIAVLGGDCLVSLAPFAWLSERYGDSLGVLWIDSHPDVQTPAQYPHAHAHVLGALMGHGDEDLTSAVAHRIDPSKVMIAGIHHPLPYEAQFIEEHGLATCAPEVLHQDTAAITQWIKDNGIKQLAIHIDLDVLDPATFRSVLFAKPGRTRDEFGNVAEGKLTMADILNVVEAAASQAETVGLTIAEHLPWDAVHLQDMLQRLPLLSAQDREKA